MSTQPQTYLTPDEYLAFEREAEVKHEYYAGEIFAFAGASRQHNLIVANVIRELGIEVKGRPCEVYPSITRGNQIINGCSRKPIASKTRLNFLPSPAAWRWPTSTTRSNLRRNAGHRP